MIPLEIITYNGFELSVIVKLVVFIILLALSALASGSETALFSLSPKNIQKIKSRQSPNDKAILKLLSMEDYLLATILVLNNLVNICLILVANNIINSFITINGATWNFVIKTVIVTFILLLFGEIIPKIFASHYPMKFSSMVARPLLVAKSFFKPLTWVLVRMSDSMNKRAARKRSNISMDELSDALEMTSDQSQEEKKMLSGIVDFVNTEVDEIMHPRLDIVALNIEAGYDEVKKTIIDTGFSRIPVFRDSVDNIEGILYVKDMLPYINENDDFEWQEHLRGAYYVPEHKKINELLEQFQNSKVHMAIVVDEYGSTMGLVSLEDILEEIVGEITDESDREQDFYKKIDENTYLFEGKTHICDLLDVIDLDDETFKDVQGQAETIAGLMLEINRDFLRRGDTLTSHGVKFTVHTMDGHRIDKVKIEVAKAPEQKENKK